MTIPSINWSGSPVGKPTSDTLTDRYVWAVLKSLPESKRVDIDRELRGSIADEVDARVASGEDAAAAERAVLTDLGEPSALARSYTGRVLALIGPDLYPAYVGLLKMLYAVVLPIVTVVHLVVQAFAGTEPGGLVGGTVAIALSLIVHLGFWTTLVFAIAERAGTSMKGVPTLDDGPFDAEQLPSIQTDTGGSRSDLIASLVFLAFIPVALVWQQFSSVFEDADGRAIPVIDPALWSFWLPYFLALTAASVVFAIVLYRKGGWNWPLVAVNAVLTVATTVPLVWLLATGNLLNEPFFDQLGWTDYFAAGAPGATASSIAFAAIGLWAIADSAWKTMRATRLARRS